MSRRKWFLLAPFLLCILALALSARPRLFGSPTTTPTDNRATDHPVWTGTLVLQWTATPRPSVTSRPTRTPPPTSAPLPTRTPRPTSASQPTQTPQLTVAALLTQSAASPTPAPATNTPAPTPRPSVTYLPLLGHLFDGVKIYYGKGAAKAYGFEAVGGSDNCPMILGGRGVLVRYEDGTTEWKDRMYLLESGLYFVREDDPNRSSFLWNELANCR